MIARIFFKTFFIHATILCSWISVSSQQTNKVNDHQGTDGTIETLLIKEASQGLSLEEYLLLSDNYVKEDNQYQSLIILDKIITEVIDPKDMYNLAVAYNRKAENLVDLSKIDQGVALCDEMIPILEKNDKILFESFCVKCGIFYDRALDYDKAFKTYNKVKEKKLRQTPVFILNYGVILMSVKKYDSAITYLKKGVDLNYDVNKLDHINIGLTNIAKILIEKEEWSAAEKYLDSAGKSFTNESIVTDRKIWIETYYRYYIKQNKLEEAKEALGLQSDYHNDIFDYRIEQKLKELAAVNERKIVLDKKVVLLSNKMETSRKTKLIVFVILISLIIIITTWSFKIIYKNKELSYRRLLKKQEVLASQMTPHFVFNCLSILQGMVLNNEHKKASEYLSKFSFLLKPMVNDELEKFVPISDELRLLENYVDLQNLSNEKDIELMIEVQNSVKETILIPPMILQPFVENSIIHGFKKTITEPEIRIHFELIKKSLRCIIKDNGVGFLSSEKKEYEHKTSLATKIVQDRFELLFEKTDKKPFIEIEDLRKNGTQGTQVILELPYILKK